MIISLTIMVTDNSQLPKLSFRGKRNLSEDNLADGNMDFSMLKLFAWVVTPAPVPHVLSYGIEQQFPFMFRTNFSSPCCDLRASLQ